MDLDGISPKNIKKLQKKQEKDSYGFWVIHNSQNITPSGTIKASNKKGNNNYILLDPNDESLEASFTNGITPIKLNNVQTEQSMTNNNSNQETLKFE